MGQKFLIIADDFTGANDTGVQLKRNGLPVKVVLRTDNADEERSVVIDTESRSLSGEEAFDKVSRMMELVDLNKFDCVIKKVDSTLRGKIAEEIAAVDRAYKSDLIIFAPALPDLGRITVNGIHQLNGIRITDTEIGNDPKKPVTEDNLRKMLSNVFHEEIIHMNLYKIRDGFSLDESRIYTFDSEKNSDLLKIIQTAQQTGKRILWVGTAAMAENIMHSLEETPPALCVCGSISEVTNRQIHEAEKQGVHLVQVSIPDMLRGMMSPEYYIERCSSLLKRGRDTILLSSASYDRREIDKSLEAGRGKGLELSQIGDYTQNVLGEIAVEVLRNVKVSGVFLTGGDTAIGFLNKVQAEGSYIVEEIAVGIPKMEVIGGEFNNLPVVTKAGAFGKDDAILYGLRKLKEKESQK